MTWGTTDFWPGTGRLSQALKILLVKDHFDLYNQRVDCLTLWFKLKHAEMEISTHFEDLRPLRASDT